MMFRKMRRARQQLSEQRCKEILTDAKRGVLAVAGDDGYPYALPVNFYYDPNDQTINVHCARVGHKIDAIRACPKVSFAVIGPQELSDDGWSYFVESVVAFGRAELVEDEGRTREKCMGLGDKYFPTHEDTLAEYAHSGKRVQIISVHIDHLTGKRVHEK